MSVKALYQASKDAKDKAATDAAKLEADRQQLTADQQQALASQSASATADSALADGTPEGKVYPVGDGNAVLKLHGALNVLPIGDPEAE